MGKAIGHTELMEALVERDMIGRDTLERLLQEQDQLLARLRRQVSGRAYLIDPVKGELLAQNYPDGEITNRISLYPDDVNFNADDFHHWGDHHLVVDRNDGFRLAQFPSALQDQYGVVSAHDFTYLYNQGKLDTTFLGLSHEAIYPGMAKSPITSGPFDLFLSHDQEWLCVSNRGAGTVSVFSTQPFASKGTVQIRQPGHTKALNVAIDHVNQQAYITDNQSSTLFLLNFETLQVNQNWTGFGKLSNLVIAPDQAHFYLISAEPDVAMHYMSLGDLRASQDLPGQLFMSQDMAPMDLMYLSPEVEHVLAMTADDNPEPHTPLVGSYRMPHMRLLQSYHQSAGKLPTQLCYGFKNPLDYAVKSLEELILDAGLMSQDALEDLKADLRLPTTQVDEGPTMLTSEVVENKPDSDTVSLTPKKSAKVEFPPETLDDIVSILNNLFEQEQGQSLLENAEAQSRLREAAVAAKEQLEIFDSTIVQVEQLLGQQGIKTVLVREALIRMLEARQDYTDEDVAPPSYCPNCEEKLNSWDCEACGFELESPERIRKRRIASAEATANLPHGHLVVPDPNGMRLLQLNPYKYISWHLDPDKVPGESPGDALWLPNNNILVADRDANAVLEVSLHGKVHWHFDTALSPQHALNNPVKATYFLPENSAERHYLIVDQAHHRVIEANSQSDLIREFGQQGHYGSEVGQLDSPSDVQYTHTRSYLIADTGNHRVLEFDKNKQLIHCFGKELGLKSPSCVQRLYNDHTLIVDAGNYRLLELNAQHELINECLYYTAKVDPAFHIISPIKMIRLINKDILIMDEDKLIQVNLSTKQLVWFSKIENLAFQPKVDAPKLVVDENGVERLVYKVLDHGDLKPVRLSQKINFKRMQKLIAARMRNETQEGEEESEEAKKERRLQEIIANRMAESKKKLRTRMTTTTSIQPSQIFEKEGGGLKKLSLYLVDKNHNGAICINRKGEVGWNYGFEMGKNLSRPYHLTETRRTVLIADTGHNRILEVSKVDRELLREIKGPENSPLAGPRSVCVPDDGLLMIADQRNKRLVELNAEQDIVWEYAETGKIRAPQSVEVLGNGNILYADSMLNTVREIDREGKTIWYYGTRMKGKAPGQLFSPEYATRLANGNTLIADTRNNRILEVSAEGRELWEYEKDPFDRKPILNPNFVKRLENGNTLIVFNNSREVIEVTQTRERVWAYKMGNDVFLTPVTGNAHNLKQEIEELQPYYNPIEKRMIRSAKERSTPGLEAHIALMDNVMMKSVRASVIMMKLEQCGTVFKTFPSPEELLADKFGQQLIIAFTLDKSRTPSEVTEELHYIAEVESATVKAIHIQEESSDPLPAQSNSTSAASPTASQLATESGAEVATEAAI